MQRNICIIQARMGSSRLPGKSILRLGKETVIERCYKSANFYDMFSKIIVVTSTDRSDDELSDYLDFKKIPYHRGSLNNVLSRFIDVIKKNDSENIVRLTGDNPLIDPDVIKNVLQYHILEKVDYTSNIIDRNLPRGNDVECIKTRVLLEIYNHNLNKDDLEHVTLYIRKNLSDFSYAVHKSNYILNYPDIRLTLDHPEDYKLIKKIYEKLELNDNRNNVQKIDKMLSKNEDLLLINSHIEQKKINKVEW